MNEHRVIKQYQVAGIGLLMLVLSGCSSTSEYYVRGPEQVFETPQQAVDALVAANRHGDESELTKILGPHAPRLINSGDPVIDKDDQYKFVAAYDVAHALEDESDGKKLLVVGKEGWPLPIPIIQVTDGWQFDSEAGEQEIINRRIGRNELNVIGICGAYVEAQREYAARNHLPNGQPQYAQHIISTKGKHDGLYWPAKSGEDESPLGPFIAKAQAEHQEKGKKPESYHGYYYKILTQQGPNAAEGARNYIVNGKMTGGFALIAYPAQYGESGVMTFIVNHNGIVFEKNLGLDTADIASHITQYDPDEGWQTP